MIQDFPPQYRNVFEERRNSHQSKRRRRIPSFRFFLVCCCRNAQKALLSSCRRGIRGNSKEVFQAANIYRSQGGNIFTTWEGGSGHCCYITAIFFVRRQLCARHSMPVLATCGQSSIVMESVTARKTHICSGGLSARILDPKCKFSAWPEPRRKKAIP